MQAHHSRRLSIGTSILLATSFAFFATGLILTSAFGQKKYKPQDDIIRNMTKKSVDFLSARNLSSGELYVAALAAAEWSKRYEGVVPTNHPLVSKATEEILQLVRDPSHPDSLFKFDRMYEPCLALILLCDVDDQTFAPEIRTLIDYIQGRQLNTGSYCYNAIPGVDDVSQTQYAALSLFVAKHHGFQIDLQVTKRALQWLVNVQTQGSWYYQRMMRGLCPLIILW